MRPLGRVEFLEFEGFNDPDHARQTVGTLKIAADPVKSLGHPAGHILGRRRRLRGSRQLNFPPFLFEAHLNPGVLASTTEF